MVRSAALLVAAGVIALVLGTSVPSAAFARPPFQIKLIFAPQAGYSSICLSCGWHGGACDDDPDWGPGLDFPRSCSDSDLNVYFRNFGFVAPGQPITVVGNAFYSIPPAWACNEVRANIWDAQGGLMGSIRYVHTANPWPMNITLLASDTGYPNDHWFALMVDPDTLECRQAGYWGGVHVHEASLEDGTGRFLLRDGAGCGQYDRYPCAPGTGGPYNPQDWWNDWTRSLCIGDADCDQWTDAEEDIIGTDPADSCGANAWPPDLYPSNCVNVQDILMFRGPIRPGAPYNPRYDLKTDGRVNVADVLTMRPVINTCCTP
jgi:hypothetical protein